MNALATARQLLPALLLLALPSLALAQTNGGELHDTGDVQFEVYDNGELGAFADDDAAGTSLGTGFVFDGDNGLYESTFLVGLSIDQVTGDAYEFPDLEWQTTSAIVSATPPEGFDQAFEATYDDGVAANPIGVEVTQRSFSAEDDDFVVVEFAVENISGDDLEEVYLGLFADWDVGTFAQNLGAYDEDQQVLYVWDDSGTSTNYFGLVALNGTDGVDVSGVFFDATSELLYTGLSNITPDAELPDDRRTVLGVGPYDIAADETVTVQFAYVGGEDEDDLLANAAAAQGNPVATEATTPAGTFTLHSAYPNPFASSTTIGFTLPTAQHVRLSVYDLLGRRVATLADGAQQAGDHTVRFDATGLPGGMYFYRLEAGGTQLTQRFTLVR